MSLIPLLLVLMLAWPLLSAAQSVIVSSGSSLSPVPVVEGVLIGHPPMTVTGAVPTANSQCFMSAPSNFATTDPAYQTCPGGGAGNPAGLTTQMQYNNAGVFGGATGLIYADPTTLATSGWKFGANGLSANFTDGTTGNEVNNRREINIAFTHTGVTNNPVFSHLTGMNLTRRSLGPGQNDPDQLGKASYFLREETATDQAQGQHFVSGQTMNAYAMGDAIVNASSLFVYGGVNASGDEGQMVQRLEIRQIGGIVGGLITSIAGQTTCNTTLTQTVTKHADPQTVTVASSTGCAIGDRVVIDAGNFAGSKPRMEMVALTGVAAGTITGKFRQNHASGDTVQPSVKIVLDNGSKLGAGRYLVNYTTSAYTTGTISNISSLTYTGAGTSWTATMVGGTALVPGCIALDSDDVTAGSFAGAAGPLKGWIGIASVTDATHLVLARSQAYRGVGIGTTNTYAIRACARVLEVNGATVWLEPNTFTWAVGHAAILAHSDQTYVSGVIRAQVEAYSPNAYWGPIYSASNIGHMPFSSGFGVSQGMLNPESNGFTNAFETVANTGGAAIQIQGKSATGEIIKTFTLSGDNKAIHWGTAASGNTEVAAEHATGSLLLGAPSTAYVWIAPRLKMNRSAASGGNPGATTGTLELVCGTNAGTAKLITYAGTSTTPITIVDNIGGGLTGC